MPSAAVKRNNSTTISSILQWKKVFFNDLIMEFHIMTVHENSILATCLYKLFSRGHTIVGLGPLWGHGRLLDQLVIRYVLIVTKTFYCNKWKPLFIHIQTKMLRWQHNVWLIKLTCYALTSLVYLCQLIIKVTDISTNFECNMLLKVCMSTSKCANF